MDSRFLGLIIAASLPVISIAGPPGCPEYDPPQYTDPILYRYQSSSTVFGEASSPGGACNALAAAQASSSGYEIYGAIVTYSGNPDTCRLYRVSNDAILGNFGAQRICASGYSWTNVVNVGYTCNLNNANAVQCPAPQPNCVAGTSVGFGQLELVGGIGCLDSCQVTPATMTAAQRDTSDNSVGPLRFSEFVQTGGTCDLSTSPEVPDSHPTPYGSNCITNGASTLCLEHQNPGCGKLNGDDFCADRILNSPSLGRCYFMGSSGYVCAHDNPPKISGEPDPEPKFHLEIPVQDSNGDPSSGLPPGSNNGTPGGTAPGQVGLYPGPSGNGTDGQGPGGGNTQPGTSRNQCETHPGSIGCMGASNYWGHFAGAVGTGIVNGMQAVIGSDPGGHPTEAGTANVGENYALVPVSAAQGCPSPVSFGFMGTSLSVSFDLVCQFATGIRYVILAVAAALSLYIVFGFQGSKG